MITVQESFTKHVLREIPVVLTSDGSEVYLFIKKLHEPMEQFLLNGTAEVMELHVFSEDQEQALIRQWEQLGFSWRYCNRPLEYMYRRVTVTYLQVSNPATGMRISLIPWFMLPGKCYPVFVYLYAAWHYHRSEQKSQRLSAEAAGRIFGIEHLHKSTVCRSIKLMDHLFGVSSMHAPLSVTEPAVLSETMTGLCRTAIPGVQFQANLLPAV
jgi:hypothetical protein